MNTKVDLPWRHDRRQHDIKVGVVLLRVGRHTHHLLIWKICQLLKSKIKIVVPKRLPPHLMLIPHPSSRLYLTGPSSSVTTSRSWQDCCHQVVRQEASVTGYINKNYIFYFKICPGFLAGNQLYERQCHRRGCWCGPKKSINEKFCQKKALQFSATNGDFWA